ncbi:hypothetical protein C8R41DRAFT_919513 [Lentinula lateritia]|uniref:F-box domain-containing protein n=1 Tax=Lentinula lateritia TaxID=40482 RepID=A0ABQ8VGC5_9AGAR|nr:hypothetical protein C8R41DRAFT_919513 [Lentinula lateritia]
MNDLAYEDLPPVYRIPFELLTEIFLQCYHDNTVYSSHTEAPFNLFSTCQRWRLVTLGIPLLWSSINVSFTHNACRPSLPVLNSWLDRSRTSPIAFSLMYQGRNAFFDDDLLSKETLFAPLEALLVHLARWQNVYLDISNVPNDAIFIPCPPSEPMILKTLAIRTFEFHPRHTTSLIPVFMDWIASLAECSPSLDSFISYGRGYITHLSGFNSFCSVPWSRLTTLTLEHVSETLALFILQRSFSLVSCNFAGLGHYLDWIPDNQHAGPQLRDEIFLPKLTVLTIITENDIDRFWGHLIVPNLQELEVHMLPSARQWHQGEDLVQFFRRSGSVFAAGSDTMPATTSTLIQGPLTSTRGPPISRLVLRNCNMRSRLGVCVKLLSDSLRDLSVTDKAMVDDAIMKLLTFPDRLTENTAALPGQDTDNQNTDLGNENVFLCPRLEQLTLRRCIAAADGKTSRMVKSRWTLPSPGFSDGRIDGDVDKEGDELARKLRCVHIEFSNPEHAEDFDVLKEMYSTGLGGDVVVKKGVKLAKRKTTAENPPPVNVPVLQPPPLWRY